MKLPIRVFVPCALLIFTLLAGCVTLLILLPISERETEDQHVIRFRETLQVVQGALQVALLRDEFDRHKARLQLGNLMLDSAVKRAWLVNGFNRVELDANRRAEGQDANALLPDRFALWHDDVRRQNAGQVFVVHKINHTALFGVYPLVAASTPNRIRSPNDVLLVVERSIDNDQIIARNAMLKTVGVFMAVIGLLATLLAAILRKQVTERLDQLLNSAAQLAKGNFKSTPRAFGNDEFGEIGRALEETGRKLAFQHQSLVDSESRLRLSQRHAGLMTLEWHVTRGIMIGSGTVWEDVFGCHGVDQEAVTFEEWLQYIHPEDRSLVATQLRDSIQVETPINYRCRLLLRDGRIRWLQFLGGVEFDHDKMATRVLSVGRDITAEYEAAELFTASQRELEYQKYALDQHAIVAITDARGFITYVNDKFCTVSRYSRAEVIGKTHRLVNSGTHPKEFFINMWRTISSGSVWKGEICNLRKDGNLYWVDTTIVPHLGGDGKPDGYIAIRTDITERKEADREKAQLQTQLIQAQKMESVGQLTGGIAHDFNNILASILGFTDLALERYADQVPEKLVSYLNEVKRSGERAKNLIAQMLAFSRGGDPQSRPLELAPLLNEILSILTPTFPSSIAFNMNWEPNLPKIVMDPTQLQQVVMNLCINARDAMDEKGSISLNTSLLTCEQLVCASCRASIAGDFVEISVKDDGPGIAPHIQERIFEPFFSTKPIDKGTGMGLAMVHGIIHRHGGHLHLDSNLGAGTTFQILLPISDASATHPTSPITLPNTTKTTALSGKVLVVDDEPSLCAVLKERLETLGLTVSAEPSSVQALALFRADPTAFDLIITDQTMPVLTGDALAIELSTIRPDLPVIVMTGFSAALNKARAAELGIYALVHKPLDFEELINHIANILESPPVPLETYV